MSIQPSLSEHFYIVLKERLQNNGKQDEIDLYYELISLGYSVGEILNAVGSIRSELNTLTQQRQSIRNWSQAE